MSEFEKQKKTVVSILLCLHLSQVPDYAQSTSLRTMLIYDLLKVLTKTFLAENTLQPIQDFRTCRKHLSGKGVKAKRCNRCICLTYSCPRAPNMACRLQRYKEIHLTFYRLINYDLIKQCVCVCVFVCARRQSDGHP